MLSSSWKSSSRNWPWGRLWEMASFKRISRVLSSPESRSFRAWVLSGIRWLIGLVDGGWVGFVYWHFADELGVDLQIPDQRVGLGKGELALGEGGADETLDIAQAVSAGS